MVRAFGKTRVVLIVISIVLIAAGVWFVFSHKQQVSVTVVHKKRR